MLVTLNATRRSLGQGATIRRQERASGRRLDREPVNECDGDKEQKKSKWRNNTETNDDDDDHSGPAQVGYGHRYRTQLENNHTTGVRSLIMGIRFNPDTGLNHEEG